MQKGNNSQGVLPPTVQVNEAGARLQSALRSGVGHLRGLSRYIDASEISVVVALLILVIALSLSSPFFLTTNNILRIGRQMTYVGLLSVGMSFVIASGQIDISVGRIITLVTFVTASLIGKFGLNPWLAAGVGIAIGALCGLLNGGLTLTFNVHPMIVTLGTSNLYWGLAIALSSSRPIALREESSFFWLGQGKLFGVPVPLIILLIVAAIGHLILRKTIFGRHVMAVGTNRAAARFAGIRVKPVLLSVMLLQGILAGLSAVVFVAQFQSFDPNVGGLMEMNTIGATVIGGGDLMGGSASVFGALMGTFLIGVMNNGLVLMGVGAYWNNFVTGAVIIVAIGVGALLRWLQR